MKKITYLFILLFFTTVIYAQSDNSQYIARFQSFVVSVEKTKTIPADKWDSLNTLYKSFRIEFKKKYKKTLNNSEYKKYNELKVRYIKQYSLKKLGVTLTKEAETVKGAINGVFK